ncbi:unnamed protein product [Rotaria sordida]|uniref:MATH domain-containing protein n=1 Tax=Rotaria sordida TaxID=392033 RepID=A0A815STL3_9BILA|nr:unnamed protein product [Rotaria sordida]CAF1496060.1 unnamed protein product [Rotaria sordida]
MSSHTTITTDRETKEISHANLKPLFETADILLGGIQSLNDDIQHVSSELLHHENSIRYLSDGLSKMKIAIEETHSSIDAQTVNQQIFEESINSLQQQLDDLKNISTDGTLIWRIANVQKKMIDAECERQTSIYSPVFYSSPNGYKMRFRLYLAGDGNARRTHMSLFFVLMRGEYDSVLQFPFSYKVTFCLFDQTSQQRHIIDSFRPDVKSSSFQRPCSDMNIASGIPKFVPLTIIQQDSNPYVRDDIMFIKAIVDFDELPKSLVPYKLSLNPGLPILIQQEWIRRESEKRAQEKLLLHLKFNNAEIDCTIYTNDLKIINLNPFYVSLNFYPSSTSIKLNYESQVTDFNIFNNVNPSSNIYCLKNLENLQLVNTNLTILSDIKNFQKLTSLLIQSDNGIIGQHLPSELGELISLSYLKLFDIKNLEDLPNEIDHLIQLRILILQNIPNFNKIPDESMGKLINLRVLNLIDLPNLSTIPSTIKNFQSLIQFEITNTNIKNLELANLNGLSTLTIKSNSILQTIEIVNMLLLASIEIQNNNELLTLKFQNLSSLSSLTMLSNSKLTSLDMENISILQTISLSDNKQFKIATFKNLSHLNSINFSFLANFESISFENTPTLSTVSITASSLLKNISFLNVPSIINLDLSGCQLTTFPESILTLKSLVNLILKVNQLSTLPLTLSIDLPNLQVLDLSRNNFQGNIFQQSPLIYLRELYLSNNSLVSIDGIGEYESLRNLDLNYNKILSIPLEITELSLTLNSLTINYNQLHSIPYQMTNMRGLTSLIATYNNISDSERQYLYQIFNPTTIQFII